MKKLQPYHHAWLSNHPRRDEMWLREMMAQGFHIHHMDGNHSNNLPSNLVLIEGSDHLRLHGMTNLKFMKEMTPQEKEARKIARRIAKEQKMKNKIERAMRIYVVK